MIRSGRVLVAPSSCTLRFLRQIISVTNLESTAPRCPRRPSTLRASRHPSSFCCRAFTATSVPPEISQDATYIKSTPDCSLLQASTATPSQSPELNWDVPFGPETLEAQALLKAGKIDDVKDMFFKLRDSKAEEIAVHQIARDLMRALNNSGRHMETPRVFHYLASHSPVPVDVNCLNKCLEAYSRGHRWGKVLNTFEFHVKRTAPDSWTYETCMMALMGLGRYSAAWDLVKQLESSSSPPTPKLLIIYLQGLRRAGTSLQDMRNVYATLEEMAEQRGTKPPEEVINFMLEEALLAGKTNIAERFLKVLGAKGYLPTGDTYAAFLAAQAASRDWDTVATTMETIKTKGYKIPPAKANALLRSFAREHDAEQTEKFLEVMAVEGGTLSATTYNLLMQRYVDENKFKQALQMVAKMKAAGYSPNAMTVRIIMEMLRNKHIHHQARIGQLLRSIFEAHPSLVPHQLRNGLDYNKYLRELRPGYDPEQTQAWEPVIQGMEAALQEEYPQEALAIFREHLPPPQVSPPAALLDVVIKAFILLPNPSDTADTSASPPSSGDVEHGRDLRQIPFQTAYLLERYIHHKIDGLITESQSPLPLILASYKFKDHYRLPITHDAAIHAASTYCTNATPLSAIHLMNDVSKTPWGRQIPWDLNALTVLLRAYSIMKDMRGAQWVVNRLVDGNFIPDRRVLDYLNHASRGGEEDMKNAVQKLVNWLQLHRTKVRGKLEKPFWKAMKHLLRDGIREGAELRERQLRGSKKNGMGWKARTVKEAGGNLKGARDGAAGGMDEIRWKPKNGKGMW